MATFIQGVTDTNLDPVLFTPDYDFLRYALGKKTNQYEQGLKSVSSSYGVLKKQLSDPTNEKIRSEYLKAAESQLQKIASSDLSLQQNVNAANAIFDPIVTNPAIAYDMYRTEDNNRQLSAMESWANSDDINQRKKFNKDIYDWVKRDLDSLKTGNGDVKNYKVQGRKAWAYVDPQDLINQAAKDMGFKVENDELGNPYVITTINGKTNRESYEMFAKSVLDANPVYKQQRDILSQAKVEGDIERARLQDPTNVGLSRDQILNKYSESEFTRSRDVQSQYIKGLDNRLSTKTSEYNAYLNQNAAAIAADPQGEKAQTALQMAQNLKAFKSQIDAERADYNTNYGSDDASFKVKKDDFVKNFVSNPEAYYARQIQSEDIIRFSNIRSSFGTRSIKADQGYLGLLTATNRALNTMLNAEDKLFDNELDLAEYGLKAAKLQSSLQGKSKTGERLKNPDGTDKTSSVDFIGTSSVQLNTTQKLTQLKETFQRSKADAINNLTSTYGGLYLLEKMGVSSADVSLIRGYISRKSQDDNVQLSNEELAAMKNAYSTMWTWAKQNPESKSDALEALRKEYGKNYKDMDFPSLLQAASKNYVPTDTNDLMAKQNLDLFKKNMSEVKRISDQLGIGMDAVIQKIKDDNSFKNLLVTDNGKTRIINADDIFKKLPAKGWKEEVEWAVDPSVELSEQDRRDISNGIFDGRIKVQHKGRTKFGTDTIADVWDINGTFINFKGRELYLENNFSAIPFTSDELSKKMKQINERVPIPILESDPSGVMITGSSGFVIRNQPKEDIRIKLTTPTQENSNILVSDGSGKLDGYTDLGTQEQDAVRTAMATKENVEQMLLWTNSPLNGGSQVVEVVMKSTGGEKPPAWSGKRYFFPININKSTNEVFNIFAQADELDEFMQYSKKNIPYKFDNFESSGVKAEVIADQPGSKTGRVILKSKYDPNTKKYSDNWYTNEIPFDLNRVTFSEVKDEIYNNFILPYMQGYMNNNRQAANSIGAQGGNLLQQLKGVVTW